MTYESTHTTGNPVSSDERKENELLLSALKRIEKLENDLAELKDNLEAQASLLPLDSKVLRTHKLLEMLHNVLTEPVKPSRPWSIRNRRNTR